MEPNKDWTDALRSALRDAEAPPPAAGWERLERELMRVPAVRTPLWRIRRVRIAAAAAAVLLSIVAGELFWQGVPDEDLPVVTLVETIGIDPKAGEEPTAAAAAGTTKTLSSAVAADIPVTADAAARAAAPDTDAPAAPMSADAAVAAPDAPAAVPAAASARTAAAKTAVSDPTTSTPATRSAAVVPSARSADSASGGSDATASAASSVAADATGQTTSAAASATTAAASESSSVRRGLLSDRSLLACAAPRRKASGSLFAAGGLTAGSNGPGLVSRSLAELAGTDEIYLEGLRYEDYRQGAFRHHQPLSFGLTVRKAFAHGLSLETGVAYTLLWSDVRMPLGTEDFSQKLHFIGVPVRVNWSFLQRRNFVLYIGAGGMVETCVAARFGSTSVEEPGAFWSVMGAVGAEYRLGGLVGLYFEPDVSYYFNQTRLRTSRTDSPATFTLRLGVRLNF